MSYSYLIAFGSNLGNRLKNFHRSAQKIQEFSAIVNSSFLYETPPMYYLNQQSFLNSAIEIKTNLSPNQLLAKLQNIENDLGRTRNIKNGPRSIDLDILSCWKDNQIVKIENSDLQLPHARINERNFVLTPMSDINPNLKIDGNVSVSEMCNELNNNDKNQCITQILPLSNDYFHEIDNSMNLLKHRTLLMGIINVTRDSFSDGGKYFDKNCEKIEIDSILKSIDSMVNEDNVDIIDIGAQSTRPGAILIDEKEEMDRILNVLHNIRLSFPDILISVDTIHSSIAKEAIVNGNANIINDISGGMGHKWNINFKENDDNDDNEFESPMLQVISQLNCCYIMNHMRGMPSTMQNSNYLNYPNGVLNEIKNELSNRVNQAMNKYGTLRWNIIIDPGIGFSKTFEQNVEICANSNSINQLKPHSKFPSLIGLSKKSFLKPSNFNDRSNLYDDKDSNSLYRTMGTHCFNSLAIMNGIDIIRVHDTQSSNIVRNVTDTAFNSQQKRCHSRQNRHLTKFK